MSQLGLSMMAQLEVLTIFELDEREPFFFYLGLHLEHDKRIGIFRSTSSMP